MELREFKDKLTKEPFSLVGDKPFYVVEKSLGGIRLQGVFRENKTLPPEVRDVLKYDPNTGWCEGNFSDEDISFSIVLT